ncbi:MAG: NmrA family NAD(P)-binding protein [bacterium]
MNEKLVVIAGATGDLGGRIVRELFKLKAPVRAIVRVDTSESKLKVLRDFGCEVVKVDYANHKELVNALKDASVVLSTLAGLRDVIVDTQSKILSAAVEAGVPRFIPSDFSADFTKIPEGENRNLNLRMEFLKIAEKADIKLTSILNGGFMDMLTGVAPFILFKMDRILCWGSPDQLTDWTTIDDTAKYTAFAALDESTPRFLKIAGSEISANSLANVMTEITGRKHKILRPGGLGMFKSLIQVTKFFVPGTNELYPPWQGMQYMHNMYSGITKFEGLDNDRYPMTWTSVKDLLSKHLKRSV